MRSGDKEERGYMQKEYLLVFSLFGTPIQHVKSITVVVFLNMSREIAQGDEEERKRCNGLQDTRAYI